MLNMKAEHRFSENLNLELFYSKIVVCNKKAHN